MVSLAVGNHFFVGRNAQILKDLRHVRADAQAAGFIHACGPFKIFRAGDMTPFGRQHFFAAVLSRAASVPNRQIGSAQPALQVFAGGSGFVVQDQRDRCVFRRRNLG